MSVLVKYVYIILYTIQAEFIFYYGRLFYIYILEFFIIESDTLKVTFQNMNMTAEAFCSGTGSDFLVHNFFTLCGLLFFVANQI